MMRACLWILACVAFFALQSPVRAQTAQASLNFKAPGQDKAATVECLTLDFLIPGAPTVSGLGVGVQNAVKQSPLYCRTSIDENLASLVEWRRKGQRIDAVELFVREAGGKSRFAYKFTLRDATISDLEVTRPNLPNGQSLDAVVELRLQYRGFEISVAGK